MSNRPIFNVPDLETCGAQPAGSVATPTRGTITTLTGASTLPNRPSPSGAPRAGVAGVFLFGFSGLITGACNVTLPLPTVGNGYKAGDVVIVQITPATLAAFAVTVTDAGTASALAVMPATLTSTGYIAAQLNAAGTAWQLLTAGGF